MSTNDIFLCPQTDSPIVRAEKREVYSGVNFPATLACFVRGVPFPRVKWHKLGNVMDSPVDPLRLRAAHDTDNR